MVYILLTFGQRTPKLKQYMASGLCTIHFITKFASTCYYEDAYFLGPNKRSCMEHTAKTNVYKRRKVKSGRGERHCAELNENLKPLEPLAHLERLFCAILFL